MKSPTTNLAALLEEREAKLQLKAELEAKLLANKVEKEAVLTAATGIEDKSSLSKLELLIAHQEMTRGKLALLERELAGYSSRIHHETVWVRDRAIEILRDRKEKVMVRFRKKLEEFYPDPALLDRLLVRLQQSDGLPPEVQALTRWCMGIGGQFAPEMCRCEFGKSMKSIVDRAFTECFPEE